MLEISQLLIKSNQTKPLFQSIWVGYMNHFTPLSFVKGQCWLRFNPNVSFFLLLHQMLTLVYPSLVLSLPIIISLLLTTASIGVQHICPNQPSHSLMKWILLSDVIYMSCLYALTGLSIRFLLMRICMYFTESGSLSLMFYCIESMYTRLFCED